MTDGWIGVGLDGTLAEYHGWKGIGQIGAPIPLMVERVKQWLADGTEVRIFTARVSGADSLDDVVQRNAERAREFIKQWSSLVFGRMLRVTNKKDFRMIELWDDRAVRVELNTGRVIR